jgi:hypothetical protein
VVAVPSVVAVRSVVAVPIAVATGSRRGVLPRR